MSIRIQHGPDRPFITMSNKFAYDAVIYPSMVFPRIRPDRLGAIAILHNIDISPVDSCRVLELGCGDGANLISIAASMPGSECIGLDLSVERIRDAERSVKTLGLTNVTFQHADVMDFDPGKFGQFDFIIAHGLYSWVPDLVREKILNIYQESLKPNGVGYISYNAYPGWHLRGYIRDAMRFQAAMVDGPVQKVESAMNFLGFIRESLIPGSLFQQFIDAEIEGSEDRPVHNIFHDELADMNQPFYFTEFVEQIERHDLRYFAESEPVSSFYRRFPEFTQRALENLGDDYLRREQYVDFLKARRFRSSLITHKEANSSPNVNEDRMTSLYIASNSRLLTENAVLNDNSTVVFEGPEESEVTFNHPLLKTALVYLKSKWPARVPFTELEQHLTDQLPEIMAEQGTGSKNAFRTFLIELYRSTVIEFRCFNPRYAAHISDRPKVSDFARWQAGSGFGYVNGVTGASMGIRDEFARGLILAADGTRTRDDLIAEITRLRSTISDAPEGSASEFVDNNLLAFLNVGLFVD